MPTKYPVALFAHRRAAVLTTVLDALRLAGVPRIYAYVDGSRGPGDAPGRDAVLAQLAAIDWAEVVLTARAANVGLHASIRGGLDDFFAREPAGIVIEEDIHLADGAYAWMCEALDRYAAEPGVAAVSAWTHLRCVPPDVQGPWFCGRWSVWGWGSWRRSWALMQEPAGALLQRLAREGIDAAAYGNDVVTLAQLGYWDAHFALACYGAHALTVYPPRSLADHLGVGGDATNQRGAAQWRSVPAAPLTESWTWPAAVREHPDSARLWRMASAADEGDARLGAWMRARRRLGRVVRRIRRSWSLWPDALLLRVLLWLFRARGRPAFDDEASHGSTPVRYLWNAFLERHRDAFFGRGLEIGNANTLGGIGGARMSAREVLDVVAGPGVQYVADLQAGWALPEGRFDVFVNQFTLHLLPDDRAALWHSLRVLRSEGTLFATFPCASQVAEGFDYQAHHVDVMRSYALPGVRALLAELGIDDDHVALELLGGAGAIASYLLGVPVDALPRAIVDRPDAEAPLLIAARITKPVHWKPRWSPTR